MRVVSLGVLGAGGQRRADFACWGNGPRRRSLEGGGSGQALPSLRPLSHFPSGRVSLGTAPGGGSRVREAGPVTRASAARRAPLCPARLCSGSGLGAVAGWCSAGIPLSVTRPSFPPGRVGAQLRTVPLSDCRGRAGGPAGRGASGGDAEKPTEGTRQVKTWHLQRSLTS